MSTTTSTSSGWTLPVAVDPRSREPMFLQIARAIAEDVRRGRLRPGARLPGTRELATTLSVHRNTVVAAYAELAAEGWIETTEATGTFVSRAMPEVAPRRFADRAEPRVGVPKQAGFAVHDFEPSTAPPYPPGILKMPGGIPDLRLLPANALARAYRRAVRRRSNDVLSYGDPAGNERFRAALAEMLSTARGLAATAGDVLVTHGTQMALDLIARTLCTPGDVVAVESLGYRPAWVAFRSAGAKLAPIPVDRDGLDVAALAALAQRTRIRAVYVTPHHQYPTMVTMSAARRLALLDLARRERIAIVEDDYDHEFHYEGRPVLPLASADRAGVVLYVGTMAKILAPGLRLGYVVAPAEVLERLIALRYHVDRQGDHAVEEAVAEMLEDGEVQRHVRRVRRAYHRRRDAIAEAFQKNLGDVVTFDVPSGGQAIWARVADRIDPQVWAERAFARGVMFIAGHGLSFDGKRLPYARFGYTTLNEREIADASRRLALAAAEAVGRRRAKT